MSHLKLFIFIFITSFITYTSFCQKWDLKVDKDGVKVYTRGVEDSNIKEFKGEITTKSNMGSIIAIIDSVSAYPKWMMNCTYSKRIKSINKTSGYNYYVVHAPWPATDRDLCSYYCIKQDTATKVVTMTLKGVKDYLPEEKDIVRIPKLNGFWQLTPLAKGVTKVVYQVHCDIGGIIPAFIVNAYITDSPYYNLLNIKKLVESPLCPKTVIKYLKEL